MYMPLKYPWSLLVIAWLLLVPTNITGISGEPTVLEGNNLQLSCEALGRPEPNITWIKQKPGNQENTVVVQEGKVLTITNINRTDAVEFTCTAFNGFGKPEYQTVYVNVTCEYAWMHGQYFFYHWKLRWCSNEKRKPCFQVHRTIKKLNKYGIDHADNLRRSSNHNRN